MTAGIKEAFTALCRKMAEETDTKKLKILKQQLRLLLEKEEGGREDAERLQRGRSRAN